MYSVEVLGKMKRSLTGIYTATLLVSLSVLVAFSRVIIIGSPYICMDDTLTCIAVFSIK